MPIDYSELLGHWRSIGYNRLLSFDTDHYRLYTVTDQQCSLYDEGTPEEFHQGYHRIQCSDKDNLSLYYAHDLTCYHYHRINTFPDERPIYQCSNHDPVINFEDFCQVFSENYAFFDLHSNDWKGICDTFRAQVSSNTHNDELAEIFRQMIAPLRDGHIYIAAGQEQIRSFSVNRGPRAALEKLFQLPEPGISLRSTVDTISDKIENTVLAPFAATRSTLKTAGNKVLSWCELEKGIGYLNVLRLFGFADTPEHRTANDLPHKPHDCGPFLQADMAALNSALDIICQDMNNMDALIIDARINGGGFDRAGLEIANRLSDRKQTAYYKKARQGSQHTARQAITTTSHCGPTFHKPVYLLISPFTLSAGEIFALCLQALPHVQLLGEPTCGILSDNLFHKLPNGWEISLSNEVYESVDNICYESIGVAPDVELPRLGQNLLADLQQGLIDAVELIQEQTAISN